jgi:hypothetical protein
MKLRDVAAAACRVLGIYTGVLALRSAADLIYRLINQVPARVAAGAALDAVLVGAAGVALWTYAEVLADRIAPGDSATDSQTELRVDLLATLAVWILGLFFVVHGAAFLAGRIYDAVTAQPLFSPVATSGLVVSRSNPERNAAIASAITYAIEFGIGAFLLARADVVVGPWRGSPPG